MGTQKEVGRVLADRALAVPVEPASGLAPTGFDPSRVAEAVRRADIAERKAVVRFMVFRAGRAWSNRQALPWWAWFRRAQHAWAITQNIVLAADIETGEHLGEQASWLNDIRGGEAIISGIDAAVARRASAIEAGTGETRQGLDGAAAKACPEGDAQTPSEDL